MSDKSPDLLQRVIGAAPQLVEFASEAIQVIVAETTGAPTATIRKEVRDLLLAGEHVAEALGLIPDLPAEQYSDVIDGLLLQLMPEQAP